MLTRAFIQKVKDATDLIDLVSEYTEVTPAGNNLWAARCPHPDHNDSTPSFRICHNANGTWSWYCAGCHCGPKNLKSKTNKNYGSDCFAFVQWMSDYKGSKHKLSWIESVEFLARRAGIPMEEDKHSKIYAFNYGLAKKRNAKLHKSKEAMDYLHNRGLTNETIDKWMLGVTSDYVGMGKNITRISFPLFSSRYGYVVGESARAIHWDKNSSWPKYKNSKNSETFHKGAYLYGLHNYDSNFKEVRITEGAMDVVLASQAGVKNIVGTLGTAFTEEHAVILKNMGVIPCFCLDGDAAGQKGTHRAVEMLSKLGVYAKVFILPDGMDMADLSLKLGDKTEEYIQDHAMLYWEFLLQEPLKVYQAKVNSLRAKLMPDILEAKKGCSCAADTILMKSFVKENFGVSL